MSVTSSYVLYLSKVNHCFNKQNLVKKYTKLINFLTKHATLDKKFIMKISKKRDSVNAYITIKNFRWVPIPIKRLKQQVELDWHKNTQHRLMLKLYDKWTSATSVYFYNKNTNACPTPCNTVCNFGHNLSKIPELSSLSPAQFHVKQ